jgi:hypothetical protein
LPPTDSGADLVLLVKLKDGVFWGDFSDKVSDIEWEIFEKTEYFPFVEIYFEEDKE